MKVSASKGASTESPQQTLGLMQRGKPVVWFSLCLPCALLGTRLTLHNEWEWKACSEGERLRKVSAALIDVEKVFQPAPSLPPFSFPQPRPSPLCLFIIPAPSA